MYMLRIQPPSDSGGRGGRGGGFLYIDHMTARSLYKYAAPFAPALSLSVSGTFRFLVGIFSFSLSLLNSVLKYLYA